MKSIADYDGSKGAFPEENMATGSTSNRRAVGSRYSGERDSALHVAANPWLRLGLFMRGVPYSGSVFSSARLRPVVTGSWPSNQ